MEEWKKVPSAPGYEVTKCGQVRMEGTLVFNRGRMFHRKPKIIKNYEDSCGYLFVNLFPKGMRSSSGNKIRFKKFVHRVVMEAFVGPCPDDMTVDHIDRNRQNNCLENLRYADITTQNRNRDLSSIAGENSRFSKLTCEQVKEIRKRKETEKITNKKLGEDYSVSSTTIKRIVSFESWKDCV